MSESRRREENSGLIDLDALMKEASDPQLPRADDSLEGIATPQPPVPVPEPTPTPTPTTRRVLPPESETRTKAVEPIAVIKSVPPPAIEPAAAAAPDVPPPPATPRPAPPPQAPARRRSFPALLVAIGVVAALVTFFVLRGPTTPTAQAITHPPPSPSPAAQPAPAVTTAATANGSDGTLDAKDLPAAVASASAAPAAHAPAPQPHATAAASAKLTTIALPDAPGARGDLGGAMREAVGPREGAEAQTTEAPTTSGARQLRPSPGAVVGAINSVLPAARECLGPDDPVRSATIVFKSDGTVARVDMAADRPTDGCVRAALARARVAPFVDDTFAARATVRP